MVFILHQNTPSLFQQAIWNLKSRLHQKYHEFRPRRTSWILDHRRCDDWLSKQGLFQLVKIFWTFAIVNFHIYRPALSFICFREHFCYKRFIKIIRWVTRGVHFFLQKLVQGFCIVANARSNLEQQIIMNKFQVIAKVFHLIWNKYKHLPTSTSVWHFDTFFTFDHTDEIHCHVCLVSDTDCSYSVTFEL